jgi:hypothetical protein
MLFYIVANIIFYLITGIGRAARQWQSNQMSFIFNLFNLDLLAIIYYVTYRRDINKKYIFILFLYYGFQLLKGWSGFFLQMIFLEIYFRCNSKGWLKYTLVMPFAFFIGGFVYQFVYPIKNYIRLGYFQPITIFEANVKLFERMSFFSHSLVGIQNADKIKYLYNKYNYAQTEIIGFFRSSIPSFIWKNKNFRPMGNLLMQSAYPDLPANTSANMGYFSYFYNLINISIIDFFIYICIFFILTFLYKIVIDFVESSDVNNPHCGPLLVFIYFMNFYAVGALEYIQYGWFSIVLTYILFIFMRIIKIQNNNSINNQTAINIEEL